MSTTTASPETSAPEINTTPISREQHIIDEMNFYLPGINPEQLDSIDRLNDEHDIYKDQVAREAYNSLDNAVVKKQLRKGEDLLTAKDRISRNMVISDVNRHAQLSITEELMPMVAPHISKDRNPDEYVEMVEYLSGLVTLDRQSWRGEENPDGTYTGGLYDVAKEAIENPRHPDADSLSQAEMDAFHEEAFREEAALQALRNVTPESVMKELESDPAYVESNKQLAKLRTEFSKIASREMGKPIAYRSAAYNQAKEQYQRQLIVVGRLINSHAKSNHSLSDVEMRTFTLQYMMDEQAALRTDTKKAFEGTKTSKFIEWFNRGNTITRVAKGAGVGLVVGGAGLILGAGGSIVAGIGTGAVIAGRFTRGYARADSSRGTAITDNKEFTQEDKNAAHYSMEQTDQHADAMAEYVTERFDSDKKLEQKKRRKAVAWGLGGIALGAAVTGVGAYVGGRDIFGAPGSLDTDSPSDKPDSATPSRPETVVPREVEPRAIAPVEVQPEYSPEALIISSGEGWNNTLKELGVPSADRAEILQLAGPKLVEAGIAYEDPSIGGYGINMTQNGRMPQAALDIIRETAIDNNVAIDGVGEVDTTISAPVAPEIDPLEGGADPNYDETEVTTSQDYGPDTEVTPSRDGQIPEISAEMINHERSVRSMFERMGIDSVTQAKLLDPNGAGKYIVAEGFAQPPEAGSDQVFLNLDMANFTTISPQAVDMLVEASRQYDIGIEDKAERMLKVASNQ